MSAVLLPTPARRATALIGAMLINALCLWFLQHGIRVPLRLPIRETETEIELIPLTLPTSAPPTARVTPPRHPDRQAHRTAIPAQAITLAVPVPQATRPQPVASAPEHKLDMQALREGVQQLGGRTGNDANAAILFNLKPEQQVAPSALSQEMGKAQRAGCGSAHANLGLLAPLALLHDAATGTGCNWQQ